ncbi:unnamed protein product [Calypogeia fissa]
MRERDKRSDSGSETDAVTSSSSSPQSSSSRSPSYSSSSEDSAREGNSARRHGSSKRKRSVSTSRVRDDTEPSSSSSDSSDADIKRRKSRSTRGKERRSRSHRRVKTDREKEKKRERKRRSSKGRDEKHGRKEKHRRKDKHDRERRKRNVTDVDCVPAIKDDGIPVVQFGAKSTLQAMNEAQLQQKEIVRRNVEMAKARLASGELQRMKHEQMEMQRLYGTVDWREKKKLRAEKSRLERTIAAGKKLASIEERENARMDAFRVALGLPTAEAQRQAEWRAEATRALAEAEAVTNKDNLSPPVSSSVPSRSRKVIGPRLPH